MKQQCFPICGMFIFLILFIDYTLPFYLFNKRLEVKKNLVFLVSVEIFLLRIDPPTSGC